MLVIENLVFCPIAVLKENPIDGIILLLTDKEAVNQLVEILKERFEKT